MSSNNTVTWVAPRATKIKKLKLYNSLTRTKEEFHPEKHVVTWYNCGPTVYDMSHMGHARSYMSFDILRRIMQDYFGYSILYVMNVTDIDDKIIKRARIKYLFKEYQLINSGIGKENVFLNDLAKSLEHHSSIIQRTQDLDKKKMLLDEIDKVQRILELLELHRKSKTGNTQQKVLDYCAMLNSQPVDELKAHASNYFHELLLKMLMTESEGILGEWLDFISGKNVNDNKIFAELPKMYEEEFSEDMKALNVLPPDVVTRVSEFVPQIIAFIEKICSNDFAYEANGSVYFDVAKFDAHPNHSYAKLMREAYGNEAALEEGEGVLTASQTEGEKRHPNDFALWKASKAGEPWWESPWGRGRPGWHIECSAMAGEVLGSCIDIHSGGVDLKFPHHDNELAQSEAYFQNNQWINYFLHTGHLHIDGCKMSKSLKNFITIKDALNSYSASQIRMVFLMHSWKDTLDYSVSSMESAKQLLKLFTELILSIDDFMRRTNSTSDIWTAAELEFHSAFATARESIHDCLCDNIDTRGALDVLRELVANTNKIIVNSKKFNSEILLKVKSYIVFLLDVFGVQLERLSTQQGDSSNYLELASVVSDVRERMRAMARDKYEDLAILQRQQLQLCDVIRDQMLPPLGVRLEDRDKGSPSIKLINAKELMKEVQDKKEAEEKKRKEKEKKKEEKKAAEQKEQESLVEPKLLFRTDGYSAWNEHGIPTHSKDGTEVTKSQIKKLTKAMEAHTKKYMKFINNKDK